MLQMITAINKSAIMQCRGKTKTNRLSLLLILIIIRLSLLQRTAIQTNFLFLSRIQCKEIFSLPVSPALTGFHPPRSR